MLTLKPGSNRNKSKNKSSMKIMKRSCMITLHNVRVPSKRIRLMQCHTHTILHGVYDQGMILRETFSWIAVTRGLRYHSFEGWRARELGEDFIEECMQKLLDRVDSQDHQPGLSPSTCQNEPHEPYEPYEPHEPSLRTHGTNHPIWSFSLDSPVSVVEPRLIQG
ncbi:uncharacterized protein Bfra_011817 [Botrytis fragariae]|uniref:Uncharacterized protein n=1 Tax=Botrytis fragariae TaxID=1964551 RepID=A0A8H6AJL5_9HELO|nr:uncharacterized protein Bfra_011817 [Botrytis fragariae]KAF5868852.1 hypothetical protein Bfra_011817 [Botrytis fragariae]